VSRIRPWTIAELLTGVKAQVRALVFAGL
jgi:hypothetical protein